MSGRYALLAMIATALSWSVIAAAVGESTDNGAPGDHEIKLVASARARVGEDSALSLTIAARAGSAISAEGPVIVELRPIAADGQVSGLEVDRRRYRRSDAADPRAESPRFDLRYRATAVGVHRLAVHVRFWVCDRRVCRPIASAREVRIDAAHPR